LSSEAQRLIEDSRGFDDASSADRNRLRAQIATQLAAGVGVGGLSHAARAAAGKGWMGRALGSSAAPKAALALMVATGAAVGVVVSWPSSDTAIRPAATQPVAPVGAGSVIVAPSPASDTEREASEAAPALSPAAPARNDSSQEPASQVLPPSVERSAPAHVRKETARRGAEASRDAASHQLAEELKLLSSAREGLKRGDSAEALARVAEHERRFPSGILTLEARALQVDALCEAGRREAAHEAAEAFLKRWPESPLSARVRSACQ
jgi:hypothetical protein